ncbi:MAG: hypothetical protein AB8B59_00925 [Maribacter sp.]
MRKAILFFMITCCLYSCNKYDIPKCDFDDATQDLLWLKDIIDERNANPTEEMFYCYISQGKLKRKTVFIFGDCNPAIDKATFVIDCEGEPIKNKDGENIIWTQGSLKDLRVIWKPDDFGCDLSGNTVG